MIQQNNDHIDVAQAGPEKKIVYYICGFTYMCTVDNIQCHSVF